MGNLLLKNFSKEILFECLIEELDGFMVFDEKGRYVFVSRKWQDITGFNEKDILNKYVKDVIPQSLVPDVINSGSPIRGQIITLNNKNGEEFHCICSYTPLFNNDKLIGGFTITSLESSGELMELTSKINNLLKKFDSYNINFCETNQTRYSIDSITGKSEVIKNLKSNIRRVARSSSTVIISGESGTGKELIAHSIHQLSSRSQNPFIKVNCAAIPAELLESEFFGYSPGAFTGAKPGGKKGKFELANGGSLFLDEIHQLPLKLQPKLLRVLQEQEIEPIGSQASLKIDVRIIVATNQNLEKLVREKKFREDLFYRLNVVNLTSPPLRNRKEDISLLADSLLSKLNKQLGMAVPGISNTVKEKFQEYDWPGNVRELENVIERGMNFAWADTLSWAHIGDYFESKQISRKSSLYKGKTLAKARAIAEKQAILNALFSNNGNRTKAADDLNISRAMLYRKLDELNIDISSEV